MRENRNTSSDNGHARAVRIAFTFLLTALCCLPAAAVVRFVDDSATGANNGSSWTDAFLSLQSALAAASSGDEIWVAAGTYKPAAGADPSFSFELVDGVAIYGGFAGAEAERSQRDPSANVTILSGDIGESQDTYHVIHAGSGITSSTIVDGVTIRDGSAMNTSGGGLLNEGGSPGFLNCHFTGNVATGPSSSGGGAVYQSGGSATFAYCGFDSNQAQAGDGGAVLARGGTLSFTGCSFEDNWVASGGGGAVDVEVETLTMERCLITGNWASGSGGGLLLRGDGASTLTNCLFRSNSATSGASAIYAPDGGMPLVVNSSFTAHPSGLHDTIVNAGVVRNCIFWNNGGSVAATDVAWSDVQGGAAGTGNIDADPLFVNPGAGDLRLQAGSPCIDAASNGEIPAGITADLEGKPRRIDAPAADTGEGTPPVVDMGAFEFYPVSVSDPPSRYICPGGSASLPVTADGWGALGYQWRRGNSPIPEGGHFSGTTTDTLTITGADAGDPGEDYNVVVTDSIGTQVPSSTASVTIGEPLAGVSGGGEICAGGSATIEADLQGIAPWTLLWSDGLLQEGVTDNPATREVSPSETTTYTLDSATDANCAAMTNGEAVVTVHPAPTAVASGDTSICAGASVDLTVDLTGTAPWSIEWADGATHSGITETPFIRTVTPANTTVYTILSVSDAWCAGTPSGSATITLPDLDPPAITTLPLLCTNRILVASVPDAGPDATYAWTRSGGGTIQGPADSRVAAFSRSNPGPMTLTATVTTPAGCTTSVVTHDILGAPANQLTLGQFTAAPGAQGLTASVPDAGEGASYEWAIDNGTLTSGQNTPSITFDLASEGSAAVRVKVTSAAGCARGTNGLVEAVIGVAISERRFPAAGGIGNVLLTTDGGWTYSSNAPWLVPTSPSNGEGSTMLTFSVAPNPDSNPRTATLTVAGREFPIAQRGTDERDGRSLEVTALAGHPATQGTADGPANESLFYLAGDVAFDAAGNAFIADQLAHTIRKLDTSGNVTTFAGMPGHPGYRDGTGSEARFNQPSGLEFDAAGNLYVTEGWAGSAIAMVGHTIRKITPAGVVTTFAGRPGTAGSQDGPLATATFNAPTGLAFDGTGNLYVVDMNNYTIRKITPAGFVSTLAGTPGNYAIADGTGPEAAFGQTTGITWDPVSGDLFVTDLDASQVRRVTLGGTVSAFAGAPEEMGWADGTGTDALFSVPWDLEADGLGNLYVADGWNYRVRKVTAGAAVTTLAGGTSGSLDGIGDQARFTTLAGITVGPDGQLLVADGSRVRRVTLGGEVTTVAGPPTVLPPVPGDGTGSDAWLGGGPMAFDPDGNLLLAQGTHLRRITPEGVVTTIAGGTVPGSADGPLETATFRSIGSVAVAPSGAIFIGDSRSIRRIEGGNVTTVAGIGGVTGCVDGPGAEALFNGPNSLALGPGGDLFVADAAVIRRVAPDGTVSTIAGDCFVAGTADGTGSAARFTGVQTVAIDPDGNLVVADGPWNGLVAGRMIRKVTPGGEVTTIAGRPMRPGQSDGGPGQSRLLAAGHGAFDAAGNYCFVETQRESVLRCLAPDGTLTTRAGYFENFGTADGVGSAARFAAGMGSVLIDPEGRLYVSEGGRIRVATWTTPPPAPSSVDPPFGRSSGGTTVTIYGSGFQPGASVTFGGTPANDVDVVDSNTITVMMTPAHEPGTVTIVVTNPDERSGQLENAYTFNGPPTVTAVTPPTGSTNGGTAVSISGSGFRPGAIVHFGDMQLNDIVFVSGSLMTAATFPHPEGTVNVTVTNEDGQQGVLPNGFHFALPPSVGWVDPPAGPASGGTAVTIHGNGFQSGATVAFGGAAATNVAAFGGTIITALTPAHVLGVVDVVVTNPDGQSASLTAGYTYAAPPVIGSVTPQAGPSAGGTAVTISGSGFQQGATVAFGGTPASDVVVSSPWSITAVTPAHAAGAVAVRVVNPDGQAGPRPNGYTFVDSSDATLVAGSGSACEGELVVIPILLSAGSAPRALQFEVAFDPAKLTVLEVATGEITAGFLVDANPTSGRVRIAMASETPAYASTGEVARITFHAAAGMSAGSAAELVVENAVVEQAAANSLPGAVTCAACVRGDVSGNALVTAYDASLVLQITVGMLVPDEAQSCAADMNQNGQVTAYDASLVLQCVVGTGPCS